MRTKHHQAREKKERNRSKYHRSIQKLSIGRRRREQLRRKSSPYFFLWTSSRLCYCFCCVFVVGGEKKKKKEWVDNRNSRPKRKEKKKKKKGTPKRRSEEVKIGFTNKRNPFFVLDLREQKSRQSRFLNQVFTYFVQKVNCQHPLLLEKNQKFFRVYPKTVIGSDFRC